MTLRRELAPVWFRTRSHAGPSSAATIRMALVVAITGALALTMIAGARRTTSAPERYAAWRGDLYDTAISQSGGVPRTDELVALAAVETVEMATFMFAGLVPAGQPLDLANAVDALAFAGSTEIAGGRLTDGRAADPATPGEFMASASFVESTGASLGDTFHFVSITSAQAELGFEAFFTEDPAGPRVEATLVGVTEDGPTALDAGMDIVVFPATLLDVGDIGVAESHGLVSLADGATIDDLRAQLDRLPGDETFGLSRAEWVPGTVRDAVSAQGQGLFVLAISASLATLVVVGQLLSRQVRIAAGPRAALGAIGMTRAQLRADPVARAALPVLGGAVVAAIAAYVMSDRFPLGFATRVEPGSGRRFDLAVHLIGPLLVTAGLLGWVFLAAAHRPARVRDRPSGASRLAGRLPFVRVGTAIRFAFEASTGERGARGAGIIATVAATVAALTVGANLDRLVDGPERWGANFDLEIGQGGSFVPDDVLANLAADHDVAGLSLYGSAQVSVHNRAMRVVGMEPVIGDVVPQLLSGRLPVGAQEIALGRLVARDLGVGIGDELTVTANEGRQETVRVVGLAIIPPVQGADGISDGGVMTLDGLQQIDADAGGGLLAITLRDGAPSDSAARLSTSTGMIVSTPSRPSAVANMARVKAIPFVLAATFGAFAALSVAHLMILSTQRRGRDIAVLQALGAARSWVAQVLHLQATAFTLAMATIAAPIGFAVGRLVYQVIVDRMGARGDVAVPIAQIAVTLAGLVALANLAAVLPARRARQLPPSHALAGE